MVSVALMTIWGVIDFFLLAAGGLTIAFSIMWRAPDVVRNLVLTNSDLTFGMVVGIFYAVTFVVSVGAIIQQNHVTIGLVVLNWLLIIDTIVTTIYGSTLWFMTLQEQANFKKIWIGTTPERRIALQDNLKCCGYDNDAISGNRLEVQIGGQTCIDEATARGMQGCMDPFVKAGDDLLMNTFTFVYGFVAILVCLFVATLCVMKKRQEQERFRRIDAKRGGRGFV